MVTAPGVPPVTVPVASTVAIAVLLLLHVPPATALLNIDVLPLHTDAIPVTGAVGFTVTVALAVHPAAVLYTITDVPADTPDTTPDEAPIVATPVTEELHVPPAGESLSDEVLPWHTVVLPVIADGSIFTIRPFVAEQPALVVYTIVVLPGPTPVAAPLN